MWPGMLSPAAAQSLATQLQDSRVTLEPSEVGGAIRACTGLNINLEGSTFHSLEQSNCTALALLQPTFESARHVVSVLPTGGMEGPVRSIHTHSLTVVSC